MDNENLHEDSAPETAADAIQAALQEQKGLYQFEIDPFDESGATPDDSDGRGFNACGTGV